MPSFCRALCIELNNTLTPALASAGYRAPGVPFDRGNLRYEFKRESEAGRETIAILFNRRRGPEFSVQLFIEPPVGLAELERRGGVLVIGTLSPRPALWPLPVRAFGAGSSLLARLRGKTAAAPDAVVASFLALLPEVEAWWRQPQSSRHIIAGITRYPGRQSSA